MKPSRAAAKGGGLCSCAYWETGGEGQRTRYSEELTKNEAGVSSLNAKEEYENPRKHFTRVYRVEGDPLADIGALLRAHGVASWAGLPNREDAPARESGLTFEESAGDGGTERFEVAWNQTLPAGAAAVLDEIRARLGALVREENFANAYAEFYQGARWLRVGVMKAPAPMPPIDADAPRFCPECGSKLGDDRTRCRFCGYTFA